MYYLALLIFGILLTLSIQVTAETASCPNKNPPTGKVLNGSTLAWRDDIEPDEPALESKSVFDIPNDPALIKFLYFPKSGGWQEIKVDDVAFFENSGFVKGYPLKVLVHGFWSNRESEFPKKLTEYYVRSSEEMNLIVVDWGAVAGSSLLHYPAAVQNTKVVGVHLAKLLIFIVAQGGVNSYDDIHLLGFSLGAHVTGVAGHNVFTATNVKIGHITGFDPAGPSFGVTNSDFAAKLDKNDATFVDSIHSNAGVLGTEEASGHLDVYPNGGGSSQPGCFLPSCNHGYSHLLYLEGLKNPKKYVPCKCEPWNWNTQGECRKNCKDGIPFPVRLPTTAQGSYYFAANLY